MSSSTDNRTGNHWRHLRGGGYSGGHLPLFKSIITTSCFIILAASSPSITQSLMALAASSSPSPSLPIISSSPSSPSSPSSQQGPLSLDPSSSSSLNQEVLYAQLAESLDTVQREQLVYGIAYALIIVLSLLGNVLVVKVTLSNLTKTNTLILSLATSDLLMSTFNIPFNYFRLLNHSWTFGSAMCFLVNFVKNTAVYNSSYTMALIAIQRYYSIVVSSQGGGGGNACLKRLFAVTGSVSVSARGNRGGSGGGSRNSNAHLKTIFTTVLVLWIASATISTLFTYPSRVVSRQNIYGAFYHHLMAIDNKTGEKLGLPPNYNPPLTMYRCTNPLPRGVERTARKLGLKHQADLLFSLVVFVTQYFIPLSIACLLYVRIGKTIAHQGRLASLKQNSKAQLREAKKRRRILMLVLVVAAFALCWAPIHIFHLLVDAGAIGYHYQAFMVVHWLAMSSVIYNPFIYCWLNESFRKTAVRVFCICCPFSRMITERNSTNSTSSTTVLPQAKSGNAMQSSFDPSSNHSTNNNNNNNNNNNITSSAAERRLSANAKSNNILAAAAATAATAAGGAKNDSNLTEKLMLKSNQPNKGKADSAAADSDFVATEVVVANGGSAALLVVSSSSAELETKSCNSKANEQKEGQLFYDGNRVEQHPALVEKKKENYSLNGSRAANHIETHL